MKMVVEKKNRIKIFEELKKCDLREREIMVFQERLKKVFTMLADNRE